MKILLSGFEAFGDFKVNPSEQLIKSIVEQNLGLDLKGLILPVSFKNSFSILKDEIDQYRPDFVVGVGLAGNRTEISIERVAINLIEARIPDIDGAQPIGESIIVGGNDGVFSSLPIKSMLASCQKVGIKCSISNSAGTYVCNELMYRLISYSKKMGYKGGFIHIPPTIEMNPNKAVMTLQEIVRGVTHMLRVLGASDDDDQLINTGVES